MIAQANGQTSIWDGWSSKGHQRANAGFGWELQGSAIQELMTRVLPILRNQLTVHVAQLPIGSNILVGYQVGCTKNVQY